MKIFKAEIKDTADLKVVRLKNHQTNTFCKIIPELGNNLVSLTIQNKQSLEMLYIPSEINKLRNQKQPFYGNPILFPFPGRIPEGHFTFQGRTFQLPINFNDGTAIHGFVYDKKWEIAEISDPSEEEAYLKAYYQSDSEIERFYPFPFKIELTYILRDTELEIDCVISNRGEEVLPFGYGIHPYFQLLGKRSDWVLYFPATEMYELVNLLPTGKTIPLPSNFDFREGKSLEGVYLDNLFGNLRTGKEGTVTCSLVNSSLRIQLTITSDKNFKYYVLYAPQNQSFICIEPYTCIPNAFNLTQKGINTGLQLLKPKERFQSKIWFRWEFL
ncbi:MAG: aldose 1-epimerase [Candidatus Helarchaeota archaeon]